jgi:hypothetical protein
MHLNFNLANSKHTIPILINQPKDLFRTLTILKIGNKPLNIRHITHILKMHFRILRLLLQIESVDFPFHLFQLFL